MKYNRAMIIFELDIELRYVDNINLLGIAIIQSSIIEPNHPKDDNNK